MVTARRSVYLDTQHPEGLEKIRELEAQGHTARLEIEEPIPTPPKFVTELRVSRHISIYKLYNSLVKTELCTEYAEA